MRIFISFAQEQSRLAEAIYRKLLAAGYEVFFASDAIPAGDGYDARIRDEVARADRLIFLASRESLSKGKYTLTELKMFSEKWPDPSGRLITVAIGDVAPQDLPPFLGDVCSLFTPWGNVASEVVATVVKRWPIASRRHWVFVASALPFSMVVVGVVLWWPGENDGEILPPQDAGHWEDVDSAMDADTSAMDADTSADSRQDVEAGGSDASPVTNARHGGKGTRPRDPPPDALPESSPPLQYTYRVFDFGSGENCPDGTQVKVLPVGGASFEATVSRGHIVVELPSGLGFTLWPPGMEQHQTMLHSGQAVSAKCEPQ
jgi:hypothetical protein